MRRLRSNDGVFFTKYGAFKLAHYVEREIRRYMNNRVTPVALPLRPIAPATPDGKPAVRPLAGPVVPLTVTPGNSEELLGGAGSSSPHGDAIATRVLVKGEPVAGAARPRRRFRSAARQRRCCDISGAGCAFRCVASAPANTTPADVAPAALPAAAANKAVERPKNNAAAKTTQNTAAKPKSAATAAAAQTMRRGRHGRFPVWRQSIRQLVPLRAAV